MTDRTFGVEIECGGPRDEMLTAVEKKLGFYPHCHGDGSGNEIHTRVLKGEKGIRELKDMMDVLRKAGGWTSQSDGMHVHHGAREFFGNTELCARLMANFLNMEDAIESIIAPYRRGNHGSCVRQFSKSTFNRNSFQIPSSRGKLNLNNLRPGYGNGVATVEFRSHEGSLHSAYAEAWVRMGQALIERTLETPKIMRSCSTVRGLGSRLGLEVDTVEVLKEKARTVENPPTSSDMRARMADDAEFRRRQRLLRDLEYQVERTRLRAEAQRRSMARRWPQRVVAPPIGVAADPSRLEF